MTIKFRRVLFVEIFCYRIVQQPVAQLIPIDFQHVVIVQQLAALFGFDVWMPIPIQPFCSEPGRDNFLQKLS